MNYQNTQHMPFGQGPAMSQPMTQTTPYRTPMYSPYQPATNMTFVVSLDEAIIRAGDRAGDMVFFDQNRPVFYRVKVDNNGVKSWQEFPYQIPNQAQNTPASQADLIALNTRLERLEKEVLANAQSNGQHTNAANAAGPEQLSNNTGNVK